MSGYPYLPLPRLTQPRRDGYDERILRGLDRARPHLDRYLSSRGTDPYLREMYGADGRADGGRRHRESVDSLTGYVHRTAGYGGYAREHAGTHGGYHRRSAAPPPPSPPPRLTMYGERIAPGQTHAYGRPEHSFGPARDPYYGHREGQQRRPETYGRYEERARNPFAPGASVNGSRYTSSTYGGEHRSYQGQSYDAHELRPRNHYRSRTGGYESEARRRFGL
ncbi:hypothetical protein LTR15_001297 [Elasticomyces elasticus]|nr:hypothetical protein LTR15_001297 [Elasticomyces elasticus]